MLLRHPQELRVNDVVRFHIRGEAFEWWVVTELPELRMTETKAGGIYRTVYVRVGSLLDRSSLDGPSKGNARTLMLLFRPSDLVECEPELSSLREASVGKAEDNDRAFSGGIN